MTAGKGIATVMAALALLGAGGCGEDSDGESAARQPDTDIGRRTSTAERTQTSRAAGNPSKDRAGGGSARAKRSPATRAKPLRPAAKRIRRRFQRGRRAAARRTPGTCAKLRDPKRRAAERCVRTRLRRPGEARPRLRGPALRERRP